MRLPGTETDPTELVLAVLVLAHHMVAAAVLLNRHTALGTLFGIGRDPVGRLGVVIALLDPLLEPTALDRIVPVLAAGKAEHMTAFAVNASRLRIRHLHRIGAVDGRTPTQQLVAFHEAVGDQLLVLDPHSRIYHQLGDGHIVHQYITAVRRARDGLAKTLRNDLRCQILAPADHAEAMAALQAGHALYMEGGRDCKMISKEPLY